MLLAKVLHCWVFHLLGTALCPREGQDLTRLIKQSIYMWQVHGGGTGILEELAGSHTRLAIYPALAVHYHRLWSVLCSIPGSRGEGSDLPSYHQTTKVTLTEGSPERSGYMYMDKQVTFYAGYALLHERHWDSQSRGSVACHQTQMLCTRIPRQQPWDLVVLSFYNSLPL